MSTITLEREKVRTDQYLDLARYPIPEFDSNGNCYSYRSFTINPIPFDSYITVKLSSDYSFHLQVCDSGIVRIQINNEYVSFGSGACIMIPYLHNSIQNTIITADVKFTKDKQCAATKNWNVNEYSKGYRVMDSNGKVLWGPANPPHCVAATWTDIDGNITDFEDYDTIPCNCLVPTEPPPYPKPSSLNYYYSSAHVGVL
jgi:hypothetical protein